MTAGTPPSLTQLLRDLESPLEDVRATALHGLSTFPSLAILRAVRRVAGTDASPTVRAAARQLLAEALGKLTIAAPAGESDAPARLRALLSSPEPQVRARVACALATEQAPDVAGLLAAALAEEKDPVVIGSLLQALAASGGAQFTAPIAAHLSSADPRVRATAVEALEATGDQSILPRLLPLLDDPHHRVRAMVARAVQAHDRQAVLACVDGMLAHAEEVVVRSALYVLRFFDGAAALPRLRDHVASDSAASRKMAIESVAFLARKGSAPAGQMLARLKEVFAAGEVAAPEADAPVESPLGARLLSDRQDVRVAAVREVVRAGREDLLPVLRSRLTVEKDVRVLATLVSALGRMGTAGDVDAIAGWLKAEDHRLRANAVEAVGLLKPGGAEELLSPALSDAHHRVRANAVVALHFTPGSRAYAVLREMAAHADPHFAASAIWAAASIATADSVAVLAGLCAAPSGEVAARARNALAELAPVMREAAAALEQVKARPAPAAAPAVARIDEAEKQRLLLDLKRDSAPGKLAALKALLAGADAGLLPVVRPLMQEQDAAVRRAAREVVRASLAAARPTASADQLGRYDAELRAGQAQARKVLDAVLDVALECGLSGTAAMLAGRLPAENDPFLRAQLVSSLALLGDASQAPLLKAFLRDPDARVRANAVDALDLLGSPASRAEAMACLTDPDPRVRAAAITASLPVHGEPFTWHLNEMLRSTVVAERAAGLYALRSLDFPERFDLLRDYFALETQPHLYETCAETLAREAHARGPAALELILEKLAPGPKRQLVEHLARKLADAAEQAEEGAEAEPAAPREAANDASALFSKFQDAQSSGELTPDALRKALTRNAGAVDVAFLLEAAVQMKLPDVVDLSMPFTHSKDRRLRLAATEALGKLKSPEASDCLSTLVRDKDADVSQTALRQLAAFDQVAALAGVQALLGTGQPDAVRRALEQLESIGDAAQISMIMDLLEAGGATGLTEIVSRLVSAWGDAATLDRLVTMHGKATPNARPMLVKLAVGLREKVGVSAEQLNARLSAQAAPAPNAVTTTLSRSTMRTQPMRAPTKSMLLPKVAPSLLERFKAHPQAKLLGVLGVLFALLVLRVLIFGF